MSRTVLQLLILGTLSCPSGAQDETGVTTSCPDSQRAFGASCFEFVGHEYSFYGAQGWCEERGGHLAFIPDEDTQHFLQRHFNPEEDTWVGLAASASSHPQYSATNEGALSWLDGSRLTYSHWASSPQPGAACGRLLKDSGLRWEATRDCEKKLRFICQFESGRAVVCAGRNLTLQCGSGQVLMIDGGVYGRENSHYCRPTHSPPKTSAQHPCGWVDVGETIAASCGGQQVCQISEAASSFVEACPQLGSYLSVDYHCKDGLRLTASAVAAAVFNGITISVKWLLRLPRGELICRLSTGDGRVIYLEGPEGLESSVVHTYTHPGTFAVAVECTSHDIQVGAQQIITVLEPVTEIGVIGCYAGNLFFHTTNCKALYAGEFHIEMAVKAGSNVTYRIQSGHETILSGLSVTRGNVPHNITVTPETVKQLGPGCHQLILYASNMVTFPEVSTELQVCVLEEVTGLQASVLTETEDCLDSADISVGVSVERGEPVLLLFSLTGDNSSSFYETREMTARKGVFHIRHPMQGTVRVKLRARNVFSSQEVDVDLFASCETDSVVKLSDRNDHWLSFDETPRKKHVRVVRSPLDIDADPSDSVGARNVAIALSIHDPSQLTNPNKRYLWECKNPCKCQGQFEGKSHTIIGSCLPEPFQFNMYYFKVINKGNNNVEKRESICITFAPEPNKPAWLSLTCTQGCDPVMTNTDAKIKMTCEGVGHCPGVIWNIKDPRQMRHWPDETKNCYREAGRRPLIQKQNGGTEYTVRSTYLEEAKSKDRNVIVVITSDEVVPLFTTFIIKTSSFNETLATPTTEQSAHTATTATPSPATSEPGMTAVTTATTITTSDTTRDTTVDTTRGTTANTTRGTATTDTTRETTVDTTVNTTVDTTTSTNSQATTNNTDGLSCSISPSSGTILEAFSITCNTEIPCSNCRYCLKTEAGKHLRCSRKSEAKSVFLPLGDSRSNYKLKITVLAKNKSFVVNTTMIAQVRDTPAGPGSSVDHLKASVEDAVAQLRKHSLLSGETVGQILGSVSSKLNSQSDEGQKAERQKLRQQMLDILIDAVRKAPAGSADEVQATARGLTAIVKNDTELSSSAQEEASLLLANLSLSLLHMNDSETTETEIHSAASTIVEGASKILDYSPSKNISDALLFALSNTQSALLIFKTVSKGPSIIQQANIGVFVNRVTPESLHTKPINIPECSCPTFSLPTLPTDTFPSEEPVDVRMLSLEKNPFSWNHRGNISGVVGALSLTTKDGSGIHVENLNEDIEILLPRPEGERANTSVLDLGNYSTTVLDVPSADSTLVLKMVPSEDPLPFKLLLGYMDYPTESNHIAMTEMPHQGATQVERYTWLLDPASLKGNAGVHYLVVRPIVGPGVKSINASLSVTSIAAGCKFWDESALDWSNKGCRVGVQTTHLVTQCLCNHLTFFGSSFFVTPNLVDPSRSAELFGTFAENPVVVCFVGALFVAYLLLVVWARRKDIRDTAKVSVTVLEDNDPMDEYRYLLSVSTGYRRGASTSSQVAITLLGADGNSEPHHLTDPKKCVFERGAVDMFLLTTPFSLGELQGVRLWHNNSGGHPAWYLSNVMVQDLQTSQKWHFLCNSWLAVDMGDFSLDKVFPVSTEVDLKRFSNLFFMKTTKDFSDGHLWYSVISRPPSSTFSCVQRVSCCFSLLLCTMLTSIMFYGIPTDPAEQTMDLGHFEFTWQQFMIGVQSSVIMFPVNILIVSVFRNTRLWEASCCRCKAKKAYALEQERNLPSPASQAATKNKNLTLDVIIKDITRIAHSLSQTVKSNIPCAESEFGTGQVDINAVLSVVEDFIRQSNKTSDQSKPQSCPSPVQTQLPEGSAGVHLGTNVEGIWRKSNKTQYLYRQLCHIESELSLLGPSSFPTPHSYSQALQQVHSMKAFLEDQLFSYRDELAQKKSGLAGSADGDSPRGRSVCCHGGLPWWFIFVGWLLVIATSCVSGYFTMLYGLKFGKERSISWLVSMIVSFFQSTLVIQPLKVLCLAGFFALIIKKIDEEDFQNVALPRNESNLGDCKDRETVRRDRNLYEPPAPADVEKMKRNKLMEQKAFALLSEILTYVGFLWMLLLVAYGQRDPNAFLLNRHIQDSFSKKISDSMSLGDVFAWANTSLLTNLFGVHPGFITDGNSKLVGNARLRQLRVHRNSCQTAGSMLQFVQDCRAPYSWEAEDTGSYDLGWNQVNISTSTSGPWVYKTQTHLRAYPVWGRTLYRGGGFVAELGPELQNASRTLKHLFRNKWLDIYTRALFVEFSVYNANVNLFCIVTLLFETAGVGAFQFHSELRSLRLYQSTGGLHIFVMAAEIVYLLFILYYMFLQGKLMKQQRWAYFRSKWNLLELTIILLSWSTVAVFIKRTLLGHRDITYYQNHKDQFASFYETASADAVLQYLIAFLVLLTTVKLWHLLRLNPKMNMITATLQRAWSDISSFLVIIVIMFIAYSSACFVIYGWRLSSYRTLADALLHIISLQIGVFNYNEVLDGTPLLGGLLIGSCVVFVTFVVLNLLISVILMAFNQEQIYHKPSEEEEIVTLMLEKICSLFGIRYKDTSGDCVEPDLNGSSGLILNNRKNNQQSADAKSDQSPDP